MCLSTNAGLMPLSPLEANKVDEWEQMVDVNIKGVLYGIAAALPRFQTQKSGHLINITSVAGHVVFPGGGMYCGTKFAVRTIAEGFRQESGATIRTTIISRGAVKSELSDHITDVGTAETIKPLKEIPSKPMRFARAVASIPTLPFWRKRSTRLPDQKALISFSRLTARRTKPPKEQIGNLIAQRVGELILIGAPDDIKIVE